MKNGHEIQWNKRGSCGASGCKDPLCCCSLCGLPIGVSDDDPRWNDHAESCAGCELCEDAVPYIVFRGESPNMEQAQFHSKYFEAITR